MRCPKCGKKTKVANSRTADTSKHHTRARLLRQVRDAVDWYTSDWVARDRLCNHCGWRSFTVELLLDDLAAGWTRKPDEYDDE